MSRDRINPLKDLCWFREDGQSIARYTSLVEVFKTHPITSDMLVYRLDSSGAELNNFIFENTLSKWLIHMI